MTASGSVTLSPDPEPLLERGDDLAAMHELLTDAVAGRGGLLALLAPAGRGKSSLAERAVAMAAPAGQLVLRASGHELEQDLGWGVARSLFEPWLLRRSPEERAELLAGPAAPARALLDAVERTGSGPAADVSYGIVHGLHWLAVRIAERRPVLLLVDDAHWADEPSLRFLLYLAGRLRGEPIALLVAARTGERGADGLLEQLVAHPAAAVREPAPLGPAAVSELVRRRFEAADDRFCRRCAELTRGNPLHVRELVSAIALEAPADLDASAERAARSLSRSVLRRLAALSADARSLAQAVAVFESETPLHLAADLAGIETGDALAAADELARVDILAGGDPLHFAHPLLRGAVYGALPRDKRAAHHGRAAQLLTAEGVPSEQVAQHLLHAAPAADPAVVEGLRRAARSAMAHGVPASAMTYLDRAVREPPPPEMRPAVLAELGRAAFVAGRRDAVAHLEAALELTGDPETRAELRLELGRTLHDFGRPADACAVLDLALAELEDGELALDVEASYLTSAVMVPERAAGAHRRVDGILARGEHASSRAALTLATKALMMRTYDGGRHDQLADLARRLLADGRLLEQDELGSSALGHVIIALSFCDQYADAERALALADAEVRRGGWATWRAAVAQLRARQRIWTGPIPDAVEDARTAVEIFTSGVQLYLPAAVCVLVRALLEHDEPDTAAVALAVLDSAPPAVGPFVAWHHEAAGRLAAHTGDHERALAELLACDDVLSAMRITNPGMFHWRSEAGLAALRLGRRDQAAALIAEELALAERFGAPRAIGVARRAQGLLERGEAAVERLRSAAEILAACGARVEHAHALAELGAAVRRAGRPREARAALRESIAIADATGARAVARRARDELIRAGGRAIAKGDSASDLTPSERRVAELAAAGRTNREIANELFVTVKAVEWHLGNVYRKLDVRGRAGLADAL